MAGSVSAQAGPQQCCYFRVQVLRFQVLEHTRSLTRYLNAPYSGLYQQTKEHGVKSRNHRMLRPKSTALEESTQNHAKHPKMFRNRVTAWTMGQKTKRNVYIY